MKADQQYFGLLGGSKDLQGIKSVQTPKHSVFIFLPLLTNSWNNISLFPPPGISFEPATSSTKGDHYHVTPVCTPIDDVMTFFGIIQFGKSPDKPHSH